VTLAQWRELQRAIPLTVSQLAGGELDDAVANGPLHDALEESALAKLAEHFSTGCLHADCWALPILAGEVSLAQLGERKLSSKEAARWLGISRKQFERIVKYSRVQPASDRPALRGGRVRHTYTWALAHLAQLGDASEVVAVRPV
jgi:hypothetical protein